jgi:hypothetical protein
MPLLGKCNVVKKPVPKHRQTIHAYEERATETTFTAPAGKSGQRCSIPSNYCPIHFLVELFTAHATFRPFLDGRTVARRHLVIRFPDADGALRQSEVGGELHIRDAQDPARPVNRVFGLLGVIFFGDRVHGAKYRIAD